MKKYLIASSFLFLFLITGCSSKNAVNVANSNDYQSDEQKTVVDNSNVSPAVIQNEAPAIASSTQENTGTTNNLVADLYPLYSGLSWNNEVATTTDVFGLQLSGFRINSTVVVDGDFPSFKNYYDTKLIANGWLQNKNYIADGAGGSIWGYSKGNDFIILSYDSTAINQIPNQPLSCPCNMIFSIFSGKLLY